MWKCSNSSNWMFTSGQSDLQASDAASYPVHSWLCWRCMIWHNNGARTYVNATNLYQKMVWRVDVQSNLSPTLEEEEILIEKQRNRQFFCGKTGGYPGIHRYWTMAKAPGNQILSTPLTTLKNNIKHVPFQWETGAKQELYSGVNSTCRKMCHRLLHPAKG